MAILDAELVHPVSIFRHPRLSHVYELNHFELRGFRHSVLFSSLNVYRYALVLCNVVLR